MHYDLHESNTCITRNNIYFFSRTAKRSLLPAKPQHFGWVVAVKGIGYKLHIEYTYRVSQKKCRFLEK